MEQEPLMRPSSPLCSEGSQSRVFEGNLNYSLLENLAASSDKIVWRDFLHAKLPQRFARHDPTLKFTFYSQPTGILQADELVGLAPNLADIFKNNFWLDVACPREHDMRVISRIFNIHPLTIEDIQTADTREKCEIFENYVFIAIACPGKEQNLDAGNVYLVLFPDCILSIHTQGYSSIKNILRRIEQLTLYLTVTADWIMYAILDDIIDALIPVISSMQLEVDTIDDLVLVLSESEQQDLLRRIGGCRKRVTFLLRLLRPKNDVLKALIKRCPDRLSKQVTIYLRDIQDHILEMLQNLEHYSETLNRSHSNYLAQISIEITQASNRMSGVMKTFTAAASIFLPLQLISGLWGMNVAVPGQEGKNPDDLGWFLGIVSGMLMIVFVLVYVGRKKDWF